MISQSLGTGSVTIWSVSALNLHREDLIKETITEADMELMEEFEEEEKENGEETEEELVLNDVPTTYQLTFVLGMRGKFREARVHFVGFLIIGKSV